MADYLKRMFCLALTLGVFWHLGCGRVSGAQQTGAVAHPEPPRTTETVLGGDNAPPDGANEPAEVARDWGIEVLGISLSAASYMLDFRYRIIDPDKAMRFASDEVKPYLIDQATGAKMYVPNPPKVGPLRQKSRKLQAGRVCFIMFANPGRMIKAGNEVTIAFGDARIENLVVNDPTASGPSAALNAGDVTRTP